MYMQNFGAAIIILMLIAAVVGWAVIELVLWLLSFVTISFG